MGPPALLTRLTGLLPLLAGGPELHLAALVVLVADADADGPVHDVALVVEVGTLAHDHVADEIWGERREDFTYLEAFWFRMSQ